MTGPKPAKRDTPTRRTVDTAAPDLHFLRSVFGELTGEARRAAARPSAATRPQPDRIVRTRPNPVE